MSTHASLLHAPLLRRDRRRVIFFPSANSNSSAISCWRKAHCRPEKSSSRILPPSKMYSWSILKTTSHVLCSGSLTSKEIRRLGLPWSESLVRRSFYAVGGTLAAAQASLTEGYSSNLAGGTHHSFPDRGEGFCVLNDVAIAIRAMRARKLIQPRRDRRLRRAPGQRHRNDLFR